MENENLDERGDFDSIEEFWLEKSKQRAEFYEEISRLSSEEIYEKMSFFHGKLEGVRIIEPNGMVISAETLLPVDEK
ncbi:MAG: hypothetical protein GY801_35440 [bacterium]|nr:hypothetical protein [bacterium]